MYDLSGVRITYGRRKWIYFLLYCFHMHSFASLIELNWMDNPLRQYTTMVALELGINICTASSCVPFAPPSSASSHETITAVSVSVCVCAGLMVFVCLLAVSGNTYSPSHKGFERCTHCTVSPHPAVKCLPLGLKCLDGLCLDEVVLVQLLSNHRPSGYIPVESTEDSVYRIH